MNHQKAGGQASAYSAEYRIIDSMQGREKTADNGFLIGGSGSSFELNENNRTTAGDLNGDDDISHTNKLQATPLLQNTRTWPICLYRLFKQPSDGK